MACSCALAVEHQLAAGPLEVEAELGEECWWEGERFRECSIPESWGRGDSRHRQRQLGGSAACLHQRSRRWEGRRDSLHKAQK